MTDLIRTTATVQATPASLLARACKRALDLAIAAPALVVTAPVVAAVGVLIKLDSPGPMFYRGWRAGRNGRPFRILKLRTMVANAEARGGTDTASDDPRITRVGARLRRLKLDELPQLGNVVLGDMSLVGPRPQVLQEVAKYTPIEREVLTVRPGITDEASIKFRWEEEMLRGSADAHAQHDVKIRPEKMRLQLEYVRDRSLWKDCVILWRTARVLFP
jgi:lipopolysaccharide/colanic/teichoic acid biosynthesis glycosyltransferase